MSIYIEIGSAVNLANFVLYRKMVVDLHGKYSAAQHFVDYTFGLNGATSECFRLK